MDKFARNAKENLIILEKKIFVKNNVLKVIF